jgi:hypothetical protein
MDETVLAKCFITVDGVDRSSSIILREFLAGRVLLCKKISPALDALVKKDAEK